MFVLLAEDDADIREVLAEVLRGEGHDVVEAENGAQALQLALARRPDVVVTDLMMPTMDGRELIQALKSQPALSALPIILISANRSRLDGLPADRMLPKPFALDDFTAAIHEVAAA